MMLVFMSVAVGRWRHATAVNVLIITATLSLRGAVGLAVGHPSGAPRLLSRVGGCPCGWTPATGVILVVPAG